MAEAQKITTFLMFAGAAEEAMNFYVSLFDDSRVVSVTLYEANEGMSARAVKHATFELAGQTFMCIDSSVEHPFTFTPAISLFVSAADDAEIERLFGALSDEGLVLMPLDSYPLGKFAWVQDRFGVSWQLKLA